MNSIGAVVHRRLRSCVAALWLIGVALSGVTAVLAFQRIGVGPGFTFAAVCVGLATLALLVLAGIRIAVWTSVVLLGFQVIGVVGSALQLVYGVPASRAALTRQLGFDPTFGAVFNLAYSTVATAIFSWIVLRWWARRRSAPA